MKILHVPCLVAKQNTSSNPLSIMTEIARSCYLEDLIMGKKDSLERDQISQYIEMAQSLTAEEIVDFLNSHMKMRMFVVGKTITAADICLFALAGPHFAKMDDREKNDTFPHAFRWIDHIQHLPGMLDLVKMRNILTSFPEDVAPLTKSQLKKM
jgi:hypothetical protein